MKNQFKEFSSWREHTVECAPGVTDLDFLDSKPNQFIIQNTTSQKVYVGISKIPSEQNYELCVEKNSTETWGRPTATGKLFFYNPTNITFNIKVFSVYMDFDMNVLKSLRVAFDSVEVSTDGIVKAFGAGVSLPSGNNKLGKVEITNLDEVTQDLLSNLESDGKVNLKSLLLGIQQVTQAVEVMSGKIENLEVSIKGDTGTDTPAEPLYTMSEFSGLHKVTGNGFTIGTGESVMFHRLDVISNVSDNDMIVKLYFTDTDYIRVDVPSKDYIANITFPVLKIEVETDATTFENVSLSLLGYTSDAEPGASYLNGTYHVNENMSIGDGSGVIYSYIEFLNNIGETDVEAHLYYTDTDYIVLSLVAGSFVSEIAMDVKKIDLLGSGTVVVYGK